MKELYILHAKHAARYPPRDDLDPQVEYQNLELFYDKLVEFSNENFFPYR